MWGNKSAAQARDAAGTEVICDKMANCQGITSRGMAQLKGNGCLCLGSDQLVFVQWIPRRMLEIPRAKILGVEEVTWHLKATKGTPMVKVTFTNEAGEEDSGAWIVRDRERWLGELRAIVG